MDTSTVLAWLVSPVNPFALVIPAATEAARWANGAINDQSYEGYKSPIPMPAPAAPQTQNEMASWTPTAAADAYLKKFQEWQKIAIPDAPANDDTTNWLLWGAIGIAGISALVLIGVNGVRR